MAIIEIQLFFHRRFSCGFRVCGFSRVPVASLNKHLLILTLQLAFFKIKVCRRHSSHITVTS